MEKGELSYTECGNPNEYKHWGKHRGDLLKTKNSTAIWLDNLNTLYTSKRHEITGSKRHLLHHDYCSTVNNGQIMESTNESIIW